MNVTIEETTTKYWSCKYERCFRKVIVDENDFTIMEAILSTVLGGPVEILGYILPNVAVDNTNEKEKTADLMIKLNEEYINLELETGTGLETTIKNFYYFISMYKQNVVRSQKYDTHTKFIQIILQFGLSLEEEIFEEFHMSSEKNILIPNFKIIRVNMDRVTKICYSNITKDIEKYKYLIMLDLPKEELMKFGGDDAIVTEFKSKIFKLNENEQFQLDMTQEEVEALVINTGKEIAYEEGISLGIEQGEKQKQLEIAKNFLMDGVSIESVSKNTGLSLEEIQKLKTELD